MIMTLALLLSSVSFLGLCAYSWAESLEKHNPSELRCTVLVIRLQWLSLPFHKMPEYSFDISHAVSSSSEASSFSVEPGSAEDVSIIVSYPDLTLQNWTSVSLASYFRINPTPFAVKGGGHATNAEFLSTCCAHRWCCPALTR